MDHSISPNEMHPSPIHFKSRFVGWGVHVHILALKLYQTNFGNVFYSGTDLRSKRMERRVVESLKECFLESVLHSNQRLDRTPLFFSHALVINKTS